MALCTFNEILCKSDAVWRNVTVYDDAAEPLHVLHMDPMNDDSESNQIMSPSLFQAMQHFCLPLVKVKAMAH
jgi:hypothetical protein